MTRAVDVGQLKAWVEPARGEAIARVVLVHGLGEHSGRHKGTAAALTQKGYEVVRFDQRGCGQSSGKPQWIESFGDYADDTHQVIAWAKQELQAKPLFLMGHSLGGAVAIHVAAEAREPLAGLVLSAPAYLPGEGVSPIKIFVGRLLERVLPGLKVPGTLDVKAISRDPAVVEAYKNDTLNASFNTVRQGNEILRALDRVPELCRKISVPTLIVHGDSDRLVKLEGSRVVLGALASKDKTLKVFPGGYHELHNDLDRDGYFAVLTDWLRSHH